MPFPCVRLASHCLSVRQTDSMPARTHTRRNHSTNSPSMRAMTVSATVTSKPSEHVEYATRTSARHALYALVTSRARDSGASSARKRVRIGRRGVQCTTGLLLMPLGYFPTRNGCDIFESTRPSLNRRPGRTRHVVTVGTSRLQVSFIY